MAVQRKWNNTVTDAARQEAIELFVGLHLADSYKDNGDPVFYARPSDTSVDVLEDLEAKEITHLGSELEGLHLTRHDGKLACEVGDEIGDRDEGQADQPPLACSIEQAMFDALDGAS